MTFRLPPLNPGEEKILDAYVLEQCVLDPGKDSGSIASEATLNDLIPGRMITFKDVAQSRLRQNISRQYEAPLYQPKKQEIPITPPQTANPKEGEVTVNKRPAEERAAIRKMVEENPDAKPAELTEQINAKMKLSEPVNKAYVNQQRFQLKKRGGAPRAARKARKAAAVEPVVSVGSEEPTFDGFLKKLQELGNYAKGLQEKQKEKIASFLA